MSDLAFNPDAAEEALSPRDPAALSVLISLVLADIEGKHSYQITTNDLARRMPFLDPTIRKGFKSADEISKPEDQSYGNLGSSLSDLVR